MKKTKGKFVIFAHSGTYDKLHQTATIALTAAAMGSEVYIVLFFWALKKFYSGQLDKSDFPVEYQSWSHKISLLMKEKKVPPISEMLKEARGMGAKIIVCSAGLEYMDMDDKTPKDDLIDDVWGLPQVLTMVEGADTVLYI
ncbi:MAG: DsrE/DsrF/DrsH-like family protein [Nitrospirae bacterium]|nr:DsrE/DsrF/DrsH-like family protein [Nitrospirota bacterium]